MLIKKRLAIESWCCVMGLTLREIEKLYTNSRRLRRYRRGTAKTVDESVGIFEDLFPREKSSVETLREEREKTLTK